MHTQSSPMKKTNGKGLNFFMSSQNILVFAKKNKLQPNNKTHAETILTTTMVLLLSHCFFGFVRFCTLVLIFPMVCEIVTREGVFVKWLGEALVTNFDSKFENRAK
jgi:hypothetical protein